MPMTSQPMRPAPAPATTLADLPSDVLGHILFFLMDEASKGALRSSTGGRMGRANKDTVALYSTCHSIRSAQPIRQLMSRLALRTVTCGCRGLFTLTVLALQSCFPSRSVMRKRLAIDMLDLEDWRDGMEGLPTNARLTLACFEELDLWTIQESHHPSALSLGQAIREACPNAVAINARECKCPSSLLLPLVSGLHSLHIDHFSSGRSVQKLLESGDFACLRRLSLFIDERYGAGGVNLALLAHKLPSLTALEVGSEVSGLGTLISSCPSLSHLQLESVRVVDDAEVCSASLQHIHYSSGLRGLLALASMPRLLPQRLPALREVLLPSFQLFESGPPERALQVARAVSQQAQIMERLLELGMLQFGGEVVFGSMVWDDSNRYEAGVAAERLGDALKVLQGGVGEKVVRLSLASFTPPHVVRCLSETFPNVVGLTFCPFFEDGSSGGPSSSLVMAVQGFRSLQSLILLADMSPDNASEVAAHVGEGRRLHVSFGNSGSAGDCKQAWEQQLAELPEPAKQRVCFV